METAPDLSETVRLERLRRRLTQADVAALAGLRQQLVSDVENGDANPDLVRTVAVALGLEVD